MAFVPLPVGAEGSCDTGPAGERLDVVPDEVTVGLDAEAVADRKALAVHGKRAAGGLHPTPCGRHAR